MKSTRARFKSASRAAVPGHSILASVLGLSLFASGASAATRTWTGAAGNGLWSDPGNWSGGVPVNGDTIVYSTAGGGLSFGNITLSLAAFTYAPAYLPVHNFHLTAGTSLTLTGFGIDNVSLFSSGGPGVIRQQLFMDGGSTLTFQNTSSVGGSNAIFSLPVDLNAVGATTSGGIGGKIVFEDNSTASGPPAYTFTGLRAIGGSAIGANGGEIRFRENASTGDTASFAISAGQVAGALGGSVIFEGNAIASSGSNTVQSGTGLGGRLTFRENAIGRASFNNYGATAAVAGGEGFTQFLDDARLDGFVQNFAGIAFGAAGGRVEFRQRAIFGGPNGGVILNRGSFTSGEGGRTVFYDDSRIDGASVFINNDFESEGTNAGGIGGVTEFRDNSRAGSVTINIAGANSATVGTTAARTIFTGNSSAENATIFANGGSGEIGAFGGSVEFSGTATAANATLTAMSGFDGGLGARLLFSGAASGGSAAVAVETGAIFDMSALTTAGTTLGSIAGAGGFNLGGKTLTVGGNNTSTVVAGTIADGGLGGGSGASLIKVGSGTLELAGNNTYTGPTNLNAGELLVTGVLGNGVVSVASGTTLSGTGTIGGAVNVAGGGIVAPGKSGAGALTVGTLTLSGTSILNYQIGGFSDRIDVNGALTLDGTINLSALPGLTIGVYRLLNYTGALTNNTLALGTIPAGVSAGDLSIQTGIAGQVNLVLNGSAGELLFWDGTNVSANGVVNGGTAAWANAPTNWTNFAGTLNQAWSSKLAVFSGTPGTVTVGENVSTTGLQFVTNGYLLNASGGAAISLVGNAAIRADSGVTAVLSAPFTGGAFNKMGTGAVFVNADNSYSGGTTVSDGILAVTNPAGLGLGTGPVTVMPTAFSYLRFTNSASAGAVTISNLGSAPTDSGPGAIIFDNLSTAGSATISNLGNAAVNGVGAYVIFKNSAQGGNAHISNLGADFPTVGASGAGQTSFLETSNAGSATVENFAGTSAGATGAQTVFGNTASAGSSNIVNRGATDPGAQPGLTSFYQNSDAAASTLTVIGGSNGGSGGAVHFFNNSTGGITRVIFQPGGDGTANGWLNLAATNFLRVTIGSIEGNGMISLGAKGIEVGGRNLNTTFSGAIDGFGGSLRKVGTGTLTLAGDSSYTGGTSVLTGILRVTNPNGFGLGDGPASVSSDSQLLFSATGRAGSITIESLGATVGDGVPLGGTTLFEQNASAGSAAIVNRRGAVANAFGGRTRFIGFATAANATITNEPDIFPVGLRPGAGTTFFGDDANAGTARVFNLASTTGFSGGSTSFSGRSSAQQAQIENSGAAAALGRSGSLSFTDQATGGNATITNRGQTVATGEQGGLTFFATGATAGAATIVNEGSLFNEGVYPSGGWLQFQIGGKGGQAIIMNRAAAAGSGGGRTKFEGTPAFISSAENAQITNDGAIVAGGTGGWTIFNSSTTAGAARITNGASAAATSFGGRTDFFGDASAGTAEITSLSSTIAGARASQTVFNQTSTAANATITTHGTPNSAAGAETLFFGTSTAGQATLRNLAATAAGGLGGATIFRGSSTAGTATLIAEAGAPGANGGQILFWEGSSGGASRVILDANPGSSASLDISLLTGPGTTIGSLEGDGIVSLGGKNLSIGGNNLSTEFAGLIRDGGALPTVGGSLTKVGTGTLRLTGDLTYTGSTTVLAGLLEYTGTFTGPVNVQAGTLNVTDDSVFTGGLVIGAGGTVVLGAAPPPAPALDSRLENSANNSSTENLLAVAPHAVPEPGTASLAALGALLFARRRVTGRS